MVSISEETPEHGDADAICHKKEGKVIGVTMQVPGAGVSLARVGHSLGVAPPTPSLIATQSTRSWTSSITR
jgi:hypothetical protein